MKFWRTVVPYTLSVTGAILFWFAYYYFNNRNFYFSLTMALTDTFFYASGYALVSWFLMPRYLARRETLYFALGFISLILVTVLLRIYTYQSVSAVFGLPFRLTASSVVYVTTTTTFIVMAVSGVRFAIDWLRAQRKVEEVNKERVTSELNFLKAQLNPHFFFNSINTLYGSIRADNEEARAILLKLSDMLRYQLYECADEVVPLEKEATYIRNFVDLQRLRIGKDLRIEMEMDEKAMGNPIPPLVLAPLVENAFKYVSKFDQRENWIRISLVGDGMSTTFTIENSTDEGETANSHPGGIGIANLSKRLELMYGSRAGLSMNRRNGVFTVHLTLPSYEPELRDY